MSWRSGGKLDDVAVDRHVVRRRPASARSNSNTPTGRLDAERLGDQRVQLAEEARAAQARRAARVQERLGRRLDVELARAAPPPASRPRPSCGRTRVRRRPAPRRSARGWSGIGAVRRQHHWAGLEQRDGVGPTLRLRARRVQQPGEHAACGAASGRRPSGSRRAPRPPRDRPAAAAADRRSRSSVNGIVADSDRPAPQQRRRPRGGGTARPARPSARWRRRAGAAPSAPFRRRRSARPPRPGRSRGWCPRLATWAPASRRPRPRSRAASATRSICWSV